MITIQTRDKFTLFEHLGELRKRIIYVLIVLVVGMIGGFIAADPIYQYLRNSKPANQLPMNAFALWDGIGIYMKFAFIIGLIIALPFAFYQLWAFVKPGLREEEQRATVRYIPGALLLFLTGLAFAYFVVFPMAFRFTTAINRHLELQETYGITQYFTFMFNILIPLSLLFELPIVIMFLTKLRILNPKRLQKMRKLSYFILIAIGTIVTPPDLISDLLVAVPLLLLYEFSLFLSKAVYRKQLEADEAWEAEFGDD